MTDMDELFRQRQAEQAGTRASQFGDGNGGDTSWLGGFVQSAASSIGETFFQKPTAAAEEFRLANPVTGFVSEMVGPTAGMSAGFKVGKALGLGEGLVSRLGLGAAERPFAAGAARLVGDMAPYEIGRLGLGFVASDASPSEMFSDVALSTLLTGGLGGIGGYLKKSGVADKLIGRVVSSEGDSNIAFRPTLERRMLRAPDATYTGELPKENAISQLTLDVLNERPAKGAGPFAYDYVRGLEGATPAENKALNGLFRPGGKDGEGLLKQTLLETPTENTTGINFGQLQEVATKAGFASSDDLLDWTITPRLLTVQSPRAAGALAKVLDESAALQHVEDGVLVAKEADGGLFVVAKRIQAGAAEGAPKTYGQAKIAPGDQWLTFLTDNPGVFAPKAHKLAAQNVETWAKMRQAWKPTGLNDPINAAMDRTMQVLTPADFQALKGMNQRTAVTYLADRLGERIAKQTGLSGSADWRQMASGVLDVVKPTRFKENQDSLYQRLWTLMKSGVAEAQAIAGEAINGTPRLLSNAWRTAVGGGVEFGGGFAGQHRAVRQIVQDIEKEFGEEGLKVVRAVSDAQAPVAEMSKLLAEGTMSPRLQQLTQELQAVNSDWLQKVIMPAVDADPTLKSKFSMLEGYIAPRKWEGTWQVKLTNEAGQERHIITAATPDQARLKANLLIAEEAKKGRKLLAEKAVMSGQEGSNDAEYLQHLMNAVQGKDADFQQSLIAAQRQYLAQTARPTVAKPSSLRYERTGRPMTNVDRETAEQLVQDIEQHMKRLGEYAAVTNFHGRFSQELVHLKMRDPTLAEDLARKSLQLQGVGGQITQALDRSLSKVLGGVAGRTPATKIALGTNSLMHAWNLGIWNPTYAMVNFLQPFQTTLPRLVYLMKAPSSEQARLMMQLPRYNAEGKVVGTLAAMHPMKIIKESFGLMKNPGDELKQFYDQGLRDGTFSAQIMEDWKGGTARVNETIRGAYQRGGAWEAIKHVAFTMAEKSEQLSRMHTFNAYYLFGKHNWGLEGDALYQFVKRGTEVSMYGYKVTDRARIFTGPIGSMAGLFKNWQLHFIGDMLDYASVGLKHGVWGPLLWQNAAGLAIGGLGGAGALKVMADGLAAWESDGESKGSYQWLMENWNGAADEVYFGLPAFLGISLQASAQMPGTDVRNEVSTLFSSVILERTKALGKAVGGAWDYAENAGRNPLSDPNIRNQLTMALAPRAFFRAASVMEGDYYLSMRTGYPMVRELSLAQRIAMGTGMNLVEVDAYQKEARRLYEAREEERSAVQGLGERFAQAQMANDVEEMTQTINRAVAMGIGPSQVIGSANTRRAREEGDLFTQYGRKAEVQRVRAMLAEGR